MTQLDPPPEDPLYLVSVRAVHLYLREQADLEDLGLADSPVTTNGVVTVMSDVINYRGRPSPFPGPKDGWQDPLQYANSYFNWFCTDEHLHGV